MGLLEKALHVKKEINNRGKKTLIDTIPGPAETDFVEDEMTPSPEKREEAHKDVTIFHELTKELLKAKNTDEFYDIFLFSVMGQVGASSSSLIGTGFCSLADQGENQEQDRHAKKKWSIQTFKGIQLKSKKITFKISDPILHQLLETKELIDLKYYSAQKQNTEEYETFLSIEATLLAPLTYNGKVIAALLLGDKATIGEYTSYEKSFILSVCRVASIVLEKVCRIDVLTKTNTSFDAHLKYLDFIDTFERELQKTFHEQEIAARIDQEMQSLGVESFAYFVRNQTTENYEVKYTDTKDVLSLKEILPLVRADHPLIPHVTELEAEETIENPVASDVLNTVFDDVVLAKMNICILYPCSINGVLSGFLMACRVKSDLYAHSKRKVLWLSRAVLVTLERKKNPLVSRKEVVDSIEPIFTKIRMELQHAREHSQVVTLVLFALKNYRRFIAVSGEEKAGTLLQEVSFTIASRLTDNDLSFRYERNKFIALFPGKKKKYIMSIANSIRNEIIQRYKKQEVAIMVTFLTAEYPKDGSTLPELLNFLD